MVKTFGLPGAIKTGVQSAANAAKLTINNVSSGVSQTVKQTVKVAQALVKFSTAKQASTEAAQASSSVAQTTKLGKSANQATKNAKISVKSVKDSISSNATTHSATDSLARNQAHSLVSGLNLNKSIAGEAQLAELVNQGGKAIAGHGAKQPLRDAQRLATVYGGNVCDWSKVSSRSYRAADGLKFEIHAYRNVVTGKLVEAKTVLVNLRD